MAPPVSPGTSAKRNVTLPGDTQARKDHLPCRGKRDRLRSRSGSHGGQPCSSLKASFCCSCSFVPSCPARKAVGATPHRSRNTAGHSRRSTPSRNLNCRFQLPIRRRQGTSTSLSSPLRSMSLLNGSMPARLGCLSTTKVKVCGAPVIHSLRTDRGCCVFLGPVITPTSM